MIAQKGSLHYYRYLISVMQDINRWVDQTTNFDRHFGSNEWDILAKKTELS